MKEGPPRATEKVAPIDELVFRAPNKLNRAANVAIAHGVFIGGIYRDHGIPRPAKKSIDKTQK